MSQRLVYYLQRAGVPEVAVRFDQVVELIGEEKAVELCIFKVEEQEPRTQYRSPRSAVPKDKRIRKFTLAQFNTAALLAAIKAKPIAPKYSPTPNPELLPSEKAAELRARGFIDDSE